MREDDSLVLAVPARQITLLSSEDEMIYEEVKDIIMTTLGQDRKGKRSVLARRLNENPRIARLIRDHTPLYREFTSRDVDRWCAHPEQLSGSKRKRKVSIFSHQRFAHRAVALMHDPANAELSHSDMSDKMREGIDAQNVGLRIADVTFKTIRQYRKLHGLHRDSHFKRPRLQLNILQRKNSQQEIREFLFQYADLYTESLIWFLHACYAVFINEGYRGLTVKMLNQFYNTNSSFREINRVSKREPDQKDFSFILDKLKKSRDDLSFLILLIETLPSWTTQDRAIESWFLSLRDEEPSESLVRKAIQTYLAPCIFEKSEDITTTPGQRVRLYMQAHGAEPLTYDWVRKRPKDRRFLPIKPTNPESPQYLYIRVSTLTDGDVYLGTARNVFGAETIKMTIHVHADEGANTEKGSTKTILVKPLIRNEIIVFLERNYFASWQTLIWLVNIAFEQYIDCHFKPLNRISIKNFRGRLSEIKNKGDKENGRTIADNNLMAILDMIHCWANSTAILQNLLHTMPPEFQKNTTHGSIVHQKILEAL